MGFQRAEDKVSVLKVTILERREKGGVIYFSLNEILLRLEILLCPYRLGIFTA
jgi:hypothetical protein